MPTILIVDDESIFRRGLEHMLAELSPDWTVSGTARDGVEALERMEACLPDVVITDIRMPRMDGIQLQSIIKEQYPRVRCIVMSGYSDFAYARESLKMGAKDYLMKPPEWEELFGTLSKLKEEWLEESVRRQESAEGDREEKQVRLQLRQHILSSLVAGTVQEEELELLDRVGLSFPYPSWTCCVVHLDRDSVTAGRYSLADPSLFALFISQFVQELIPPRMRGEVFIAGDSKVVALLNHEAGEPEHEEVVRLAKRVCHQIRTLSSLTVTIGVGGAAGDLESAARSFAEAEMALLYRLVQGGDRVLAYEATAGHAGGRRAARQRLAPAGGSAPGGPYGGCRGGGPPVGGRARQPQRRPGCDPAAGLQDRAALLRGGGEAGLRAGVARGEGGQAGAGGAVLDLLADRAHGGVRRDPRPPRGRVVLPKGGCSRASGGRGAGIYPRALCGAHYTERGG
ncbi:response regulator [Paenibacillus mucilaginosus]|uniref:response regulator n=1 Tax=Paenibacillus mucilaginosus TaxID=61624 RepID=UPI00240DE543|nr:response regulator [Paenibacillus mucilaginosus]